LFKRELGLIIAVQVTNVPLYEKDLLLVRAPLRGFTLVASLHHRAADGALGVTFGAFESVGIDVGDSIWTDEAGDADFPRPAI
jgi:hypothetical protein